MATAAEKKKAEAAEEVDAQEQAAAESDEPTMLPDGDPDNTLTNLREAADEAAKAGVTYEEAKQVLVDSDLPAES